MGKHYRSSAVTDFFKVEMLQCPWWESKEQSNPHKCQESMGKSQKAIVLASELV